MQIHTRRVPLLLLAVGCVVAGTAACLSGSNHALHQGAKLSAPVTLRHLHGISGKAPQTVFFEVRNVGDRRLVLHEIDPECNCSGSGLRTFLISPGETEQIPVRLAPLSDSGQSEATAEFTTNDPSCPRLRLCVTAVIVSDHQLRTAIRHRPDETALQPSPAIDADQHR